MVQQRGNGAGAGEFVSGVLTAKYAVAAVNIDVGFDLSAEDDAAFEAVARVLEFCQPMMYQVDSTDGTEILANAHTEANYDGVGSNGSFTTSADHVPTDLVTLSDSTVITVDVIDPATKVLIDAQDETSYTGAGALGTFSTSADHADTDVITLSDGTLITVDANTTGSVTEFTVDNTGSDAGTAPAVALTFVSSTGSGTAFTLTPGVDNVSGSVTEFTVDSSGSATPGVEGVALTFGSSDGPGTDFTLTPGGNNIVGGGGIIHLIMDAEQFDAASLQVQLRAIGTDNVNGQDFSGVSVTEGTSLVIA